jgi:hypothetical protein
VNLKIPMHIRTFIDIHIYIYIYINIYIFIYIRIHMYTYIYMNIYRYKHICIHTSYIYVFLYVQSAEQTDEELNSISDDKAEALMGFGSSMKVYNLIEY